MTNPSTRRRKTLFDPATAHELLSRHLSQGMDFQAARREVVAQLFPFSNDENNGYESMKRNEVTGQHRKELLDYLTVDNPTVRAIRNQYQRQVCYDVHSLDVWGNSREGYEVNQEFKAGKIYVPEEHTAEDIFLAMKEADFINEKVRFLSSHQMHPTRIRTPTVLVSDDSSEGFYALRDAKTNEPLYHLYEDRSYSDDK